MSEAVRYYTRDTRDTRDNRDSRARKETSEDSGVESGHSIENNGKEKINLTSYGGAAVFPFKVMCIIKFAHILSL